MPFSAEFLSEQSTMVLTLSSDFDPQAETPEVTRIFTTTVGASEKPIHLIIDFRAAAGKATMDSIMHGASILSHLVTQSNVCDVLMVTDTEVMKMVAAGMATPIYGNLKIKVFSTIEEAQEYTRTNPVE